VNAVQSRRSGSKVCAATNWGVSASTNFRRQQSAKLPPHRQHCRLREELPRDLRHPRAKDARIAIS